MRVLLKIFFVVATTATALSARYKLDAGDGKWITLGMGFRSSFNAQENAAPNKSDYSKAFNINNARIYLNGQIQEYVKFEFNTECMNCSKSAGAGPFALGGANSQNAGANSGIILIDAIGKFELHNAFNIWFGRMLLPSERGELVGPYRHSTFDGFRTPFYPADLSTNFNGTSALGGGSGTNGRDNAFTFWGKVHPFNTHIMYVASISQGLRGDTGGATAPNQSNYLMYTARLQWNLLNDEPNGGYYLSDTYFGKAGDILALGASGQYQKEGAGNPTTGNISDFTGMTVDLVFEKVLGDWGVFTLNGEFKRMWASYGAAAYTTGCFCTFNGKSYTAYALYLIPVEVGIGKFQPYGRYTNLQPEYFAQREEVEYGLNYVISGYNARISLYGRYGNIETTSFASPIGNAQDKVNSFHIGMQLQI